MALFASPSPARLRVSAAEPHRLSVVRQLLGHNTHEALAYALIESRWDAAERCLEAGLPADSPNPDGQTPIVWCVLTKQLEGVRVMVKYGADLTQRWRGSPLLHLSVMAGSAELVAYLLCQGADPDEKDENGLTPLHIAAMRGSRIIANTLLHHGADKSITDDATERTAAEMWNDTALHPLEYAQFAGVTLDHKSLFHWFISLDTLKLDECPSEDSGAEEGCATSAPSVPSRCRYQVDREEAYRKLVAASVVGIYAQPSTVARRLREMVGDRGWVTFGEFSAAVLHFAAAVD
jgi:hypothetical protein